MEDQNRESPFARFARLAQKVVTAPKPRDVRRSVRRSSKRKKKSD